MKDTANRRGTRPALHILLVLLFFLCIDGPTWAQVGVYSRPSDFYVPSQSMGILGGRYTYSTSSASRGAPLAPETDPLHVKMAPQDGYGGGQRTEDQGRTIPSLLSPAYSVVPPSLGQLGTPIARGMGVPLASPMAKSIGSSTPQYGPVFRPGRSTLFEPTVEADTFSRMPPRHEASLDNITPRGPTASAIEPGPAATATRPSPSLEALQQMSQHQATRLTDEGDACLQRAMDALRAERWRAEPLRKDPKTGQTVNPYKPGAVDLFKQARLLLTNKPEPTLGLIASLVSTTDYDQAASLIGPLVSRWPEVMTRDDFSREFFARPDQVRTQMLAIRDIALERGDADLRLLWAFYRWHMESRQAAAGDVAQLARQQGPDSPAMAMARAMVAALGTGG